MRSYPIKIWSGLLSDGHVQKIENALWEFIWLINKVTSEEEGIGMVLKGKPVKIEQIKNDLKRDYRSVLRHVKTLQKHGYINLKRCPYGFVITINNSKKFKNIKNGYDKNIQSGYDIKEQSGDDNLIQSGYDKNIQSENIESVQKCQPDMTKMSKRYDKNVQNKEDSKTDNKTDSKTNTYCRVDKKIDKKIFKIPYKEIITYLNEKCEKNYKENTAKTQNFIKARFNEGFSLEDFKKVIDVKSSQWKSNPDMNRFLRPETLFGTKFESYLNEKIIEVKKGDELGKPLKHFKNERDYSDEEQKQIDKGFYS